MEHALLKIKTTANPDLDDDAFVTEVMDRLLENYPQIHGYRYERTGSEQINLLIWGDIEIVY